MKDFNRRDLLKTSLAGSLGLSIRAAITGLPAGFLLSGKTFAAESTTAKHTIFACSQEGESINTFGPGTYGTGLDAVFQHPVASEVDETEVGVITVNGRTLTAADLANEASVQLGDRSYNMARAFNDLPAAMRQNLAWFNYKSRAVIHSQFGAVLNLHGNLHNELGRGAEQLPAAIAYETAEALGSVISTPFVLSGSFSSAGAPLNTYSPTKVKELVNSLGTVAGGIEAVDFKNMYDHFIDKTYAAVKTNGTPAQKRFMDQFASSRKDAEQFGFALKTELGSIEDDSIDSQFKTALAIVKLNLAPVVVTNYSFSGDNHNDSDLTIETTNTLQMIQALNNYWHTANSMGVADKTLLATLDVFGRTAKRGIKGGRSHGGDFSSGLIFGNHVKGGLVGGIEVIGGVAQSSGINSEDGTKLSADIGVDNSLDAYYKSLMMLAGVPSERRDVRIRTGKVVNSLI